MYTKTVLTSVWAFLGTALVACTSFAGDVAAENPVVTVAYRVNTEGLDLNTPSGAHTLYHSLQNAADLVCSTHSLRVDLVPPSNFKACHEQALGQAVRSVNRPLLTQVYLETHTLQQAEANGIEVPVQLASK